MHGRAAVTDLLIHPQFRLVGSRLQKRSSPGRLLQVKVNRQTEGAAGRVAKIGALLRRYYATACVYTPEALPLGKMGELVQQKIRALGRHLSPNCSQ